MDMCQTTLKFSLTLTVLNNEKLPMFVHASRTELRATLPKGVLNCAFAVGVFAMNRTSLSVTTVRFPVVFRSLRLNRVVGVIVPTHVVPHTSPAKIPTDVTGALGLPRNGLRA